MESRVLKGAESPANWAKKMAGPLIVRMRFSSLSLCDRSAIVPPGHGGITSEDETCLAGLTSKLLQVSHPVPSANLILWLCGPNRDRLRGRSKPLNTVISTMAQTETRTSSDARKYLPLLMLLFAGSGCAALIYEVVWYQLLQLAIGSTSVSLGILLAMFMGGLCIGSIWLPRLQLRQHPLKIYAALELGI